MSNADLLFGQGANPSSGPIEIVFGDDDNLPPGSAELRAVGRITGLRGFVAVRTVVRAAAAGSITGLRGFVAVPFDINVERPVAGTSTDGWQQGQPLFSSLQARFERGAPVSSARATHWKDGLPLSTSLQLRLEQATRTARVSRISWQRADRMGVPALLSRFEDAKRLSSHAQQRMEQGRTLGGVTVERLEQSLRLRHLVQSEFQNGRSMGAAVGFTLRRAMQQSLVWATRFEEARKPPPGITPPPEPPEKEPCYLPELPAHLVFDLATDEGLPSHLLFVCERHGTPGPDPEDPQYIIPLLRVYMTVHSIDAVLLPSLERVSLSGVTISANDDGYGWSMSASGPIQLMDQLAPVGVVPQRVRITIDGIQWVFACEQPERSRKFGERGVQVRGSSVTSLLGAPHMPTSIWSSATALTAQQIISQALEFTGVAIDWRIDDWLVPAGAWSHQGTPLSVAQRVAEAVGAVVRSHRTDATLQFAPRYPHMPWAWPAATPNVRMPGQIITTDTLQAVVSTRFNAVYVSGETQGGVLGHVVRAGSAGDVLAPQVTDALITHELAARQRGSAILAAAAITKRQPITVPLLTGGTNPGLILPGYLIEVVEPDETWRGLVRGITVTAGMPTVRQQLEVERAL